jgi:hypothetical protein
MSGDMICNNLSFDAADSRRTTTDEPLMLVKMTTLPDGSRRKANKIHIHH